MERFPDMASLVKNKLLLAHEAERLAKVQCILLENILEKLKCH